VISTRSLGELPAIVELARLTGSLAMLDAILCDDWQLRYYSFDSKWADGESMASMRNGSGDHWYAWFTAAGTAIHGVAHESPMFRPGDPWPGIWDALPPELGGFRAEPAFDTDNSSFCIWRLCSDVEWRTGEISYTDGHIDPDGSAGMLSILGGDPESYRNWASEYFECDLPLRSVAAIYRHRPLTEELVRSLNPEASLGLLQRDVATIGFPHMP